jgi:hypothetical protein
VGYQTTVPSTRTSNVCGDREDKEIQATSEIATSQIENENFMVDAISSTYTSSEVKPKRRRPTQMTRLTIDVQGRILDNEEMKLIWLASGKCVQLWYP